MSILLHLPLRQGLEQLGSNLITNSDFSSWSGAADPNNTPTGFSSSNVTADNYFQDATNACRLIYNGTGTYNSINQGVGASGRSYRWGLNVLSNTASFRIETRGAGGVWTAIAGTGAKSGFQRVPSGNSFAAIGALTGTADTAVFTDFSIREYWLTDLSASTRHAWPQNDPAAKWTTLASGITVLDFNGTTDLLDLGTDFLGTGNLTVKFWMRPDTAGETGFGHIITNGAGTAVYVAGTTLSASSDGFVHRADSAALTFGQWYHCVVTRTAAGVVNIYLNGALSGAANQDSGTPVAASTNVFIGNRGAGDYTFDGPLSEIVVEDAIWSAGRVAASYANERPLYNSAYSVISSQGSSAASVTARGTLNSVSTTSVTGLIGGY